jgi:hypothetical protein
MFEAWLLIIFVFIVAVFPKYNSSACKKTGYRVAKSIYNRLPEDAKALKEAE